jgi:5'-methylthioadenosine phosphorylase
MEEKGSRMIGVIGGTGLYKMDGLEKIEKHAVKTPFGNPSSEITTGFFRGQAVAFLPRHGASHQILPSEINFRANVWALKFLGVRRILSVSAVGSLKPEITAGSLAIPNQYMDFTKGFRAQTFFGNGMVAHISTAEPSCPVLTSTIIRAGRTQEIEFHSEKTYACVEGPRLGTRAESFFFQKAGADLIGMTNVPEVFLAREAQICYCTVAVVTDYDCWCDDPAQHATVDKVIELYMKNLSRVQSVIQGALLERQDGTCSCREALKGAVMSQESALSSNNQELLAFLRK